jgi:hypothetical protein
MCTGTPGGTRVCTAVRGVATEVGPSVFEKMHDAIGCAAASGWKARGAYLHIT